MAQQQKSHLRSRRIVKPAGQRLDLAIQPEQSATFTLAPFEAQDDLRRYCGFKVTSRICGFQSTHRSARTPDPAKRET